MCALSDYSVSQELRQVTEVEEPYQVSQTWIGDVKYIYSFINGSGEYRLLVNASYITMGKETG